MEDVFEKSLGLIRKFLDTHSPEDVQRMTDQWGIERGSGQTVKEYFEGYERAFDYSKMLQLDRAETLISRDWEFSEPVSVDLKPGFTCLNPIDLKLPSSFISDFKGGHAV